MREAAVTSERPSAGDTKVDEARSERQKSRMHGRRETEGRDGEQGTRRQGDPDRAWGTRVDERGDVWDEAARK